MPVIQCGECINRSKVYLKHTTYGDHIPCCTEIQIGQCDLNEQQLSYKMQSICDD